VAAATGARRARLGRDGIAVGHASASMVRSHPTRSVSAIPEAWSARIVAVDLQPNSSFQTWRRFMSGLTQVEILWLEKRIENRIRFGRIVEEKILDHRRRVVSFAPGSIFAFVRWTSNDFGTVISRIDILRAVAAGQRCSTVPYVKPGGDILLRLSGWPKVERVLQLIDAIEALGIDPADAAPDYWHHVHNRLSVNEAARSYTKSRHQAWLHRRRILP
jgi:hypothetical protein